MTEPTLWIIRGVSGSGKTTLAKIICDTDIFARHYEADQYFTLKTGKYEFDPKKLSDAHEWCRQNVENAMSNTEQDTIIVSNTFTRKWEYAPYVELARKYGYQVQEIICRGHFKNIHGLDETTVTKQLERFEY